ncbi:hypothetical protein ABKN59_004973 [Abortiporus biennis]
MMRRLLHVKPMISLGKRSRDDGLEDDLPSTSLHQSSNCVALQNEDSLEDVVVITALDSVPFCCHADLLMMTREQLLNVANSLNEKLPSALHIDTSDTLSDVFIRNSIEFLVGIRQTVPAAPNPKRSMTPPQDSDTSTSTESILEYLRSPVSPLASKSRADVSRTSLCTPKLAVLHEVDEENIPPSQVQGLEKRLKKRRRITLNYNDFSDSPASCRNYAIGRSQSQRVSEMITSSPLAKTPTKVLRSRSDKLPPRRLIMSRTNITMTRGRHSRITKDSSQRSFGDEESSKGLMTTSTPIKRRFGTIMAPDSSMDVTVDNATPVPSPSVDSRATTPRAGLKRKASMMSICSDAEVDGETSDVTSRIYKMNMASSSSGSDMDIGSDSD